MENLLSGAAIVDITPPLPVDLGGMFASYKVNEIREPLLAQALALSDSETDIIVINCDLSYITEDTVKKIRKTVTGETGIYENHIIVSATHNHTSPKPGEYNAFINQEQVKENERVLGYMIKGISEAAIKAFNNKSSAKLGYGTGNAERCCFNRRYIMQDGHSMMNPTGEYRDKRLKVEGPIDDQIQVLWFEDTNGNIISAIINFSTHAAMMYKKPFICADFPGVLRNTVKNALGKNFPILFLPGASGNLNTIDFENDENFGMGEDGYKHIGNILAGEVIKLMHLSRAGSVKSGISIISDTMMIPYRETSRDEIDKTMSLVEKAQKSEDPMDYLFDFHKEFLGKPARILSFSKER